MTPAELEHSGGVKVIAHDPSECAGQKVCPLHKRSNHVMRGFPQRWRSDLNVIERVCSHGIGHTDPDQFEHWAAAGRYEKSAIHACDGCCTLRPAGAKATPLWNRRDVVRAMASVVADMNLNTEDVIPIVDEVSAALTAALPLLMGALADDVKRDFDEGSGISSLVEYIERWRPSV